MPGYRCIVAGLDDLGTELFVVGNIQFLFVAQEPVKFLPLEKVVDQSPRAFLAEYFKGLSDFNFTIRAVLNLLFEFQGFSKSSGGKHNKAIRIKDQLIPIVFSIHNLEVRRARERIGNTVFLAWLVN
jgi:hypothetical protein